MLVQPLRALLPAVVLTLYAAPAAAEIDPNLLYQFRLAAEEAQKVNVFKPRCLTVLQSAYSSASANRACAEDYNRLASQLRERDLYIEELIARNRPNMTADERARIDGLHQQFHDIVTGLFDIARKFAARG